MDMYVGVIVQSSTSTLSHNSTTQSNITTYLLTKIEEYPDQFVYCNSFADMLINIYDSPLTSNKG